MLLFELFENTRGKKDTVVYAFGRFNPPNAGHQRLVNALKRKAGELNADWYLFISPRDSDPEKNPLTGAEKLAWWRAILPQDRDHFVMDPAIPMSDFAAEYLNKKGY
jgi:nicotinamide mononucleotide adenylyltransferase